MKRLISKFSAAVFLVSVLGFGVAVSPASADASQDNVCERGRVCLYNERNRANGVAEYVWDDRNYSNNTFNHSSCGIFGGECKLNDQTAFLENRGANNDVCHYQDAGFATFRFRSLRGQNWNTGAGLSSHDWVAIDRGCP